MHLLTRRLGIPVMLGLVSFAYPAAAQVASVGARITAPIDDNNLTTLRGNTYPLARPEYDRGAAPDSLPLSRMLLVLKRSPQQEAALIQRLDDQQTRRSPEYHHWLTPDEFGHEFGPADADIQTVTGWLTGQGFQVDRVAHGRMVIEFSGTAGQLRRAFHTEMHRYRVRGEEHWANASDPQIPAALAPVVAGFASLNNFPRRPMVRVLGTFTGSMATGQVRPQFTVTMGGQTMYAVGPGDFATIYNAAPLLNTTTNGSGQTIAIVGQSNIAVSDATSFQSLFGLASGGVQVILDGPDPGIVPNDETESDTDVEWAGAVAPGAAIKLVAAETTETTAGIDLSALYIVDNNLAPIMSESYGACELALGVAGNAFQSDVREQAAAEGITVVVSAGDSGSAGCDGMPETAAAFGLAVNGVASTPFGVAVGGTDFNDVGSFTTYWNSSNNAGILSSAKSYIPEVPWNDSCAFSGVNSCRSVSPQGTDLIAGSGGPSSCGTLQGTDPNATCVAGYAKPSWQMGAGVPADGVRDIPDISFFAGDGHNRSFYVICAADVLPAGTSSCVMSGGSVAFLGVGGTSVGAPAFAGVMALVDEATGDRQGNANYVLYKLAAQSGASCTSNAAAVINSGCIFYDVASGNNSVACVGGTPNCSATTPASFGVLVDPKNPTSAAWNAGAGYDLTTGLGSVNVANLVNNWNSVSFNSTTTTITNLSPTTLTHGQAVKVTVTVASSSGKPTGTVALNGGVIGTESGITDLPLTGGVATGTTTKLPGGTYNVTARYGGDGTFASSTSSPPIQVTVNPESSKTDVGLVTFDFATGAVTNTHATSAPYGSPYVLRVDVTNGAGQQCATAAVACPTGQVALTDNGAPLDLGTFSLNSQGYFEDQPIQLPSGSHTVSASYSGDASFEASTSSPDTLSITKAVTTCGLVPSSASLPFGQPLTLTATVSTVSNGAAPSGTVQFLNGSTALSGTVTYTGTSGQSTPATLLAVLPASLASTATLTAKYGGDANYSSSTSSPVTVTITPGFMLTPNPSTVTIASPGGSGTSMLTLATGGGFSGTVALKCTTPATLKAATCSLSPASLASDGNTTLTITTTGGAAAAPSVRLPGLPEGFLLIAAGAGLALLLRRRRRLVYATLVVALVGANFVACGGGGSSTNTPPPPVTSPGTYMLTVTGTSGAISSSATVTVTVQ